MFEPVIAAAESEERRQELFAGIGWELESIAGLSIEDLQATLTQLVSTYTTLAGFIETPPETFGDLRNALEATKQASDIVRGLGSILDGLSLAPPPAIEEFGLDLVNFLVTEYLRKHRQIAYLLGILSTAIRPPEDVPPSEPVTDTATGLVVRHPHSRPEIRLARIADLLTNPLTVFRDEYLGTDGLATAADAQAVADKLFRRLAMLLTVLGAHSTYGYKPAYGIDFGEGGNGLAAGTLRIFVPLPTPGELEGSGFGASLVLSSADHGDLGLVVRPFGTLVFSEELGRALLELELTAGVEGFAVGPHGLTLPDLPGINAVSARIAATRLADGEGPALRVGNSTGTRLEIGLLRLSGEASLSSSEQEYGVLLEVGSATVAIAAGDGDGFLKKILPPEGLRTEFDLALGWSKSRGVYIQGSASLETAIALHTTIGPFTIETLHLVIGVAQEGMGLEASISGNVTIGPLVGSVERIGIKADLGFEQGNLGPVDLDIGFKPPTGLGLVIDAGPVTGGGFLSLDTANGRYAGILQVEVYEIAVTAIGLLDTRLPGGEPGFSFLIIISAEFAPIQLGYGFTLNGVGGLAGIHRTIVVEALQSGIRNHSVDHILFPEDPVRDAPQIISDLRTIFPPAEDRYVFGPMAIIGWGTPTLIEIELGIILELPMPVRLVLLGQVNAVLPDEDSAVVQLHLDVLGIVDFGQKLLSMDASLHDSRIAAFPAYGDMAMRLSWAEPPAFALALGGLNPHFQPPPGFPELRRLTLALGTGENPRINLQAYMALTSNTVQFGSLAELYAEAGDFNIAGWLGFDALFVFKPFSMMADINGGVALRRHESVVAGIQLTATLTGPSPWHAWGEACVSILFVNACVQFDETFGEPSAEAELPPTDPWPLLQAALQDPRNWSAGLPASALRVVTLAQPAATGAPALVDPVGRLTVRERVLPLNSTLTKFGETEPTGPDKYTISGVTIGDEPVTDWTPVTDYFAPAQFEQMADAEKLSRPSFELMESGVAVASDSAAFGVATETEVIYETVIIDSPWDSREAPLYTPRLAHQLSMVQRGAAALSPLTSAGFRRFAPNPREPVRVSLDDEACVIASTEDLATRPDISAPATSTAAHQALSAYLTSHPLERGRLQVMPAHEAEPAA